MIRIMDTAHVRTSDRDTYAWIRDLRYLPLWSALVEAVAAEPVRETSDGSYYLAKIRWGVLSRTMEILVRDEPLSRRLVLHVAHRTMRTSWTVAVTSAGEGARVTIEMKIYVRMGYRWLRLIVEPELTRVNRRVVQNLQWMTGLISNYRAVGIEPTPAMLAARLSERTTKADHRFRL